MNITISDPNPKTSDDVNAAYQNGYNQYPIDHPVTDDPYIDIVNLAQWPVYVYSYDGTNETAISTINIHDVGRVRRLQVANCTELRLRTQAIPNYNTCVLSFLNSNPTSLHSVFDVKLGLVVGDLILSFDLSGTQGYGTITLGEITPVRSV
ncbi:hypothetical protein [Mucilaginibacter flavus]|uniref:hypothetical protein n=1 Tax=Mucilaginibacter flavus TaxID=931504 RepID=UPI0025B542A5|nr:hypothetical protein [Mucilaginibacter flavus]MDN3584731.1 hypothetical protein [Mucilaginibacter flavus]